MEGQRNFSGSKRSRQSSTQADGMIFDKVLFKKNVATLFYKWYTEELYNCKPNADLLRAARVMIRLKALLPSGTKIEPKPTDSRGLQKWTSDISKLSADVLTKAKYFCDDILANDGQVRLRKKPCKGNFYGTEVIFNEATKAAFNLEATNDIMVTPLYLQQLDFKHAG